MANEGFHEPIGELSDKTRDMYRAITSLMEELEVEPVVSAGQVSCRLRKSESTVNAMFLLMCSWCWSWRRGILGIPQTSSAIILR